MKKLVILSTQRSGSTMVCDDIAGTEKLGRPSEYFIKVIESMSSAKPDELKSLIHEAMEKGKSANNVISLKIMANQILPIGRALMLSELTKADSPQESFFEYFNDAFFVRVIRNDKVSQAVSRVIAQKTNVYHTSYNLTGMEGMLGKVAHSRDESKIKYDETAITSSLNDIHNEECFIDNYCKEFKISTFNINYESVVNDRSYINDLTDIIIKDTVKLKRRRLNKVSGETSKKWIERYKLEHNII